MKTAADCNDWTTKEIPEPPVRHREIEHATTCRGLEVTATRHRYGSLVTTVIGYVGTRRVTIHAFPTATTDDQLRAEALALANDLADAGISGKPTPVEAIA